MMFLDIETVPVVKNMWPDGLDTRGKDLFMKKFRKEFDLTVLTEGGPSWFTVWNQNAALHAEFGRVACISIGIRADILNDKKEKTGVEFRVKSFIDQDEVKMLLAATEVLLKEYELCGHNILDFDVPFLYRRLVIKGLPVPPCLNIAGKKTWDIPHHDTLILWRCGQFKNYTSLDQLAYALGLPSPKETISGADVGPLWYGPKEWLEKEQTIKTYCQGDVVTQANCFYRLKGLPIIQPDEIIYVD